MPRTGSSVAPQVPVGCCCYWGADCSSSYLHSMLDLAPLSVNHLSSILSKGVTLLQQAESMASDLTAVRTAGFSGVHTDHEQGHPHLSLRGTLCRMTALDECLWQYTPQWTDW